MSGFLGQLGVKAESTYGTGVTVDCFYEFDSESLAVEVGRVESSAIRAGSRAMRSDRRVPYIMGASGSFQMPVLSKGFGFWLAQCLGTVGTAGPAETSVYTHTGTIGSMTGDMFTAQVGVPQAGGGTITHPCAALEWPHLHRHRRQLQRQPRLGVGGHRCAGRFARASFAGAGRHGRGGCEWRSLSCRGGAACTSQRH